MGEVPWTAVIVVAIVLVLVAIALWLFVRWRRRRAPAPAGQAKPAGQIAAAWTRFYRELYPRARHFPTVVVVGEAGAGKSHLIDARVDWRSQANQFYPSAADNPILQLYLGSGVVVHELSAPLLHDITGDTRRALARLWRHMGPSATVVVVVDARAVSTTPPEALRELGQLVRGKIRAFPARCRAGVQVRVCLSHADQIAGYDDFAAVIGPHHGAIDVGPLSERLVDAAALITAARGLMATYDPNLAYGLTHRSGEEFARLVGFYGAFPVLLTQLAPLLHSLTGDDPDQPRYRPAGLYLGSVVPDSHVGDPFLVDRGVVDSSIARQRRFHRRASLAVAAAGVIAVGALLWWHDLRVVAAEQSIAAYITQNKSGQPPSDAQVRKVAGELARMRRSERLWLGGSYLGRKQHLEEQLAKQLRDRYLLPQLRVEQINRSTMLYVVSLLYASEANGLRALARGEIQLWASKLNLSSAVVSAYLDVAREQYEVAEPFDPEYTGSNWQSFIFDQVKPLYEQTQRISQAQLDRLNIDPPQLYDPREYDVRKQIVTLLSDQLSLATHPPITKLLKSPLVDSAWVVAHETTLRGIATAVARRTVAPASPSPRTLGELGAALEQMLAVPQASKQVHQLTRDTNGTPETFAFDIAVWNHKLAQASAALTIAAVRTYDLDHPEEPIGFFEPGAMLRGVGATGALQGTTVDLPGAYTAAAFKQHVAPALDFITLHAGKLELTESELGALGELYREQIEAYSDRYTRALRAYYNSFRFDPGSEQALPFSLAALTQPSSWFVRFLSTVSVNAMPELGDGRYYEVMEHSLADFRPLAELLVSAKGAIPGILPYQKIIAELVAALDPGPAAAPADADAAATLASTLSRAGALTLTKLTGADKDQLAQVSGWLSGANIDRDLQDPFLAPVQAVYSIGLSNINRAIAQAWSGELSPQVAPLLARFPFRPGARDDVVITDLDAVVRAQGKQPGSFWASFQRWLGPVTVLRNGRYQWIGGGVAGPASSLSTVNDLARLSRALWDADGNPQPLSIRITPQPLEPSPVDGRVPTIAYLRSGASAIYAFNQRPGSSTLLLHWWDQGMSSIILELRNPGTADTETHSVDESESAFSFYRLLCRSRIPDTRTSPDVIRGCGPGRGRRIWDIPLDRGTTRSVTLTLDADPWDLFEIAH